MENNRLTCTDSAGVIATAQRDEHRNNRYGAQECLEKLYGLEELQEQGRLIELPCKPESLVYKVRYIPSPRDMASQEGMFVYEEKRLDLLSICEIGDFGKTVFLKESMAQKEVDRLNKKLKGEQ